MSASEAHREIDAIWHIESPKIIAAVARITGDVGLAEDFAQGGARRADAPPFRGGG